MMNRLKVWFYRHDMLKDQVKLQDYVLNELRDEFIQFKEDIFNKFDVHQEHNHQHLISMQNEINFMNERLNLFFDEVGEQLTALPGMKRSITTQKSAIDEIRKKIKAKS